MTYTTKAWVIGLLIGSLIATITIAYAHIAELISEPSNPILHLLLDWIIVIIPLLPITYIIARVIK